MRRLESIDLLRGGVMVLMALDHVRDFFGDTTIRPTNLAVASGPVFLTRWITHLCAPAFCLLMGAGVFLASRKRSTADLSRYLLLRGLWLIFLEVVVARCFGLQFNFDYHVTMLTVLWSLGWSMIALAALVHLPPAAVGAVGVVMIATHNLFDGVRASSFGALAPVWTVLHSTGVIVSSAEHVVFVAYPLIPWIGVAAAGYALAQVYDWPAPRRRALLWRLGIGCIVAFVVLRALNLYGDPAPWTTQRSPAFTVLSFLNTTKYPPSLLFLLMTLGPGLCILGALERGTPRVLRPMLTFGRVPLFYYLAHLTLIHLLAVVVCYARYGDAHWMFESPTLDNVPYTVPPGWPFSLPVVYVFWVAVVAMMYPLCVGAARVRMHRSAKASAER
jgi:uncharacterized membrane protein